MEWGYRRVRQLLRKLRTPGAIQDDELAMALCRLTGAPSVRDAVLMLAERALRDFPPVYWTIVRRVDVDGESSQAVADEIHLSERSFFRYRASAIAAVAAEIEAVTRSAPPKRSEDVDVLALVARGRYLWKHRTTAALQRAARYFERALGIAPTFARAHAGGGAAARPDASRASRHAGRSARVLPERPAPRERVVRPRALDRSHVQHRAPFR